MLKWLRCQPIFERFSELLKKYREPIINSFVMVEKIGRNGKYKSRLSNGPLPAPLTPAIRTYLLLKTNYPQ